LAAGKLNPFFIGQRLRRDHVSFLLRVFDPAQIDRPILVDELDPRVPEFPAHIAEPVVAIPVVIAKQAVSVGHEDIQPPVFIQTSEEFRKALVIFARPGADILSVQPVQDPAERPFGIRFAEGCEITGLLPPEILQGSVVGKNIVFSPTAVIPSTSVPRGGFAILCVSHRH